MYYHKYLVKEYDVFDAANFPAVVSELDALNLAMSKLSTIQNKEILIAFVRDHHIKLEWMNSNPEVTDLLTSKAIITTSLEALFDSCTHNIIFQNQLEAFIESRFAKSTITY